MLDNLVEEMQFFWPVLSPLVFLGGFKLISDHVASISENKLADSLVQSGVIPFTQMMFFNTFVAKFKSIHYKISQLPSLQIPSIFAKELAHPLLKLFIILAVLRRSV